MFDYKTCESEYGIQYSDKLNLYSVANDQVTGHLSITVWGKNGIKTTYCDLS